MNQQQVGIPLGQQVQQYQNQLIQQQQYQNYNNQGQRQKEQELKQLLAIVIPMESNQDIYQMELKIKGNETSLKQVFDQNNNNYWTKVFKGHSPKEPPSYSVFRKTMNIEQEYYKEFQSKNMHILLLKCEGYKFPRNPNAHRIELFCNTHFYGPLVIVLNMSCIPYYLANFPLSYLSLIDDINLKENRQYPPAFIPTNSQKKNKQMPFYVNKDTKADFSDDLTFLKAQMSSDAFYMYKYKTAYCPQKNIKHDWSTCLYAHRPNDFRRPPDQYQYSPEDCKNIFENCDCPLGFKCMYSHSTYERLYHPLKYKTNLCDQCYKSQRKTCKRGSVCAFYHHKNEKRIGNSLNHQTSSPIHHIKTHFFSPQKPGLQPKSLPNQFQISPVRSRIQSSTQLQYIQQQPAFQQQQMIQQKMQSPNFFQNNLIDRQKLEKAQSFKIQQLNQLVQKQNEMRLDQNTINTYFEVNQFNQPFSSTQRTLTQDFLTMLNPDSFQTIQPSVKQKYEDKEDELELLIQEGYDQMDKEKD